MTRDDIIRMAREAGQQHSGTSLVGIQSLERFAALAAAAERERIACEFDKRAVYDDGTPSSGWYEPAEIVRAMRPKADVQPQRQQKAGAACAGHPA